MKKSKKHKYIQQMPFSLKNGPSQAWRTWIHAIHSNYKAKQKAGVE